MSLHTRSPFSNPNVVIGSARAIENLTPNHPLIGSVSEPPGLRVGSGYVTQEPETGHLSVEVAFARSGNRVGVYTFGVGFGRVAGTVVGSRLEFEWEFAQSHGSGVWGYRGSTQGAGIWVGQR